MARGGKQIAERIKTEVETGLRTGMNALRDYLLRKVKETVSVPATTRQMRHRSGRFGTLRATTKAVRGQPPRLVTGKLREGVEVVITGPSQLTIGSKAKGKPTREFSQGFPYPWYHEVKEGRFVGSGWHPWIVTAVKKNKDEITKIMGKMLRVQFKVSQG